MQSFSVDPGFLGLIFFYLLLGLWLWVDTGKVIGRNRKYELRYFPSRPEDYPNLDMKWLNVNSARFEEAGFVWLGDFGFERDWGESAAEARKPTPLAAPTGEYSPPTKGPNDAHGFERFFVHPEHGCTGRILRQDYLIRASGKTRTALYVAIESWTGTEESDWTYRTFTLTGHKMYTRFLKIYRGKRRLHTQLDTRSTSADLLKVHLEKREKIANAARLNWGPSPNVESVLAARRAETRHIRWVSGRFNPLSLIIQTYTARYGSNAEWMGELTGQV